MVEKKRNLYRGERHLDYETPFSDRGQSMKKIKEHMRAEKKRKKETEKILYE